MASTDASMTATEGVLGTPSRRREPGAHAAGDRPGTHRSARWGSLALSLGALGVVYGDIGTSPLYTIQLIFRGDHPMGPSPLRVYGALSLIFWALMVVVTLKYVLLILRVDNDGEGGIMALVALIERVSKTRRKTGLVIVGVLGASLFYGDGMLTPAISVVSAVSGLNVASPALAAQIVPFSLVILIALFALQRFGTGAVGGLFGPIMVIWFLVLGALGLKEVAAHPGILRAVSPTYAAQFVADDPKMGFFALGSVFLAVTGAEAIYADMGHFGRKAITRAWLGLAFPCLLLNYMGQGALILARPDDGLQPVLLPRPRWPDGPEGDGRARDGGDGDRVPGGHLGRVLGDPAGDPARVPAADEHPPHVEAHHRADLHPDRELAPARVGHRARPHVPLADGACERLRHRPERHLRHEHAARVRRVPDAVAKAAVGWSCRARRSSSPSSSRSSRRT